MREPLEFRDLLVHSFDLVLALFDLQLFLLDGKIEVVEVIGEELRALLDEVADFYIYFLNGFILIFCYGNRILRYDKPGKAVVGSRIGAGDRTHLFDGCFFSVILFFTAGKHKRDQHQKRQRERYGFCCMFFHRILHKVVFRERYASRTSFFYKTETPRQYYGFPSSPLKKSAIQKRTTLF